MTDDLFDRLDARPEYKHYLYRFGYLICRRTPQDPRGLLDSWQRTRVRGWELWTHPDQRLFLREEQDRTWFLIGHAMDPVAMRHREEDILSSLAENIETLSDLTGVFIAGYLTEESLTLWPDAAAMLMASYGLPGDEPIVTSHVHLAMSLFHLEQSDYVRRLTAYRFYRLFGFFLPGDRTPCDALRRLIPNHRLTIRSGGCTVERFYPTREYNSLCDAMTMEDRAAQAARILENTLALIPRKWEKPAITLTGGCDSKTTLACARQVRERYRYFSYSSQEAEDVDARGAARICRSLGLDHSIHTIPDTMADEELVRDIIAANTGAIGTLPAREIRKRLYLSRMEDVDVEVKSWVSEVGRAYFHKRFARTAFPKKPTPRLLTTLYKVFFHDRRLVRETDAIFREYIRDYLRPGELRGFDWIDLFFWEFRMGGWNGLVITGEHRFAFDITIPYNNRRLLELLLAVPVRDRMEDRLYTMIRSCTDPGVDAAGVSITNLKHTSRRARIEGLYLAVHSRLPF